MFVKVDYVRKMTVKKSYKYDEYRSFEYLLFLFLTLPPPPPPPAPQDILKSQEEDLLISSADLALNLNWEVCNSST